MHSRIVEVYPLGQRLGIAVASLDFLGISKVLDRTLKGLLLQKEDVSDREHCGSGVIVFPSDPANQPLAFRAALWAQIPASIGQRCARNLQGPRDGESCLFKLQLLTGLDAHLLSERDDVWVSLKNTKDVRGAAFWKPAHHQQVGWRLSVANAAHKQR